MRKFDITFQLTGEFRMEVEARDMEEAVKAARESADFYIPQHSWVQDIQMVKAEEVI